MEQVVFKTGEFDGPLDLLLFLIKSNKMNIYDIPIADITAQYLDYVEEMQKMDMDFAGEFIIMAAELLLIKSRMLLPAEKNEEGEISDPRTELVLKLLEYQKYKELSGFLRDREDIGRFSYVKPGEKIKGLIIPNDDINVSTDDLLEALKEISERIERRNPPKKSSFSGIVSREPIPVSECIKNVRLFFGKNDGKADFNDIFIKTCETRPQIVGTFLAILELLKQARLKIKKRGDKIMLYLSETEMKA